MFAGMARRRFREVAMKFPVAVVVAPTAVAFNNAVAQTKSESYRVNLLPDARVLQTDLVRADWIFSIASLAGSRDTGAPPPIECSAAEVT
jgi:hypothetical protein